MENILRMDVGQEQGVAVLHGGMSSTKETTAEAPGISDLRAAFIITILPCLTLS